MTAKAEAVLTAVELYEDPESRSLHETRLKCRFAAGGREAESADALPGDRTADFKAARKSRSASTLPIRARRTWTDADAHCGG